MCSICSCWCGRKPKSRLSASSDDIIPERDYTGPFSGKKVYITRAIAPDAVALLKKKFEVKIWDSQSQVPRETLLNDVQGASAILCTISDRIDDEVLQAAGPDLQIISSMASDMSHIDVAACEAKQITLHNVANLTTNVSAELTCALLLTTTRRLMEGRDAVIKGDWGLWKPMWICGAEFSDKTLGIMGLGKVGWSVAIRMKPFNIKRILYFDKETHPKAEEIGAEKVELEKLFIESDFVVCTLALTPETKGIVNSKLFSICKPDSFFVNTSRGDLVNHNDLVQALTSKRLAGAGLDVTDPEPLPPNHALLKLPNCIVTPHMGTATVRARRKMALSMADAVMEKVN